VTDCGFLTVIWVRRFLQRRLLGLSWATIQGFPVKGLNYAKLEDFIGVGEFRKEIQSRFSLELLLKDSLKSF